METRITKLRTLRIVAVGVGIAGYGIYEYISKDEALYILISVLSLAYASQALARYGYVLKLRELKKKEDDA